MSRAVLRLILDVVLTIVVALLLLTLWQWFLIGSLSGAPVEALRVLFNFMDVGLATWLILLIVAAVRTRTRGSGPGTGHTWVLALLGAVVNLIVVAVVGFIQGGTGPWLVLFAITAGIAVLIAAAIVVPIVHRLARSQA
ncbi:MAG: hypothetical protein ABIQ01_08325 [Pseudolysinimonas sp.]